MILFLFFKKKKEAVPMPPSHKESAPAQFSAAELLPVATKPKSNAWTLLLVFTFIFFVAGIILPGIELNEYYHVLFFGILSDPEEKAKKEESQPETSAPATPTPAPAPATPTPPPPPGPEPPPAPPPNPEGPR